MDLRDNGWTALHYCAKYGDYESIKSFADVGIDINLKTNDGKTILHIAANYGHLNLCKTLIDKHNFDVNATSNARWTALHYSARSGSYELVNFFADMGIDIYLKEDSGWNCLHIAALYGHLNLCNTLLHKHKFKIYITDNEGWTALHHSARNGSYELVKCFVDMGTDIHLKNNLGWNCLHIAALCGHLNLCKILVLRHNFDVDIASNAGGTALHYSARYGNYELIKLIFDIGTDIQLKNNLGQNCLHIAAAYKHLNLCKTLIDKHNFDVHMVDNNGWTALHYAARNGSSELVSFFADVGIDIHLKDNLGQNCLHFAALSGHLNLCKTLLDIKDFDVHMTNNVGWTALHYSARNGTYELVKFFADMEADIYVENNLGSNCLHIAALSGHLNLCKILLDKHKFNVHMADNQGWTALHYSARNGSYKLVSFFVDMGTDIQLKDNLGRNCLHIAALYGDLNLCKALIIKHNFHVHMVDNEQWTPLHYSARNGNYELVRFFVDMGTDIYLKDSLGWNCLHIAACYGHFNLCKTLIDKHYFDRDIASNAGGTALHYSARNGSYELLTLFAGKRTDIHLKNNLGQNCLHIAAAYKHLDLCKTLINKQSFDVHMADNNGWTALHYAGRNGSYELVSFFVDIGIDIHSTDNLGQNCLHFAALLGHLNLCKTLLDKHNFDLHMTNNEGWTALHYSARNGTYELVKFFADAGTDIHLTDNLGQNCLHIAALYGHLSLFKTLINKHSFDVNLTGSLGCTALHYSAKNGNYELVTFLNDRGVDIHLKDNLGRNCLHISALHGHLSLCKALIDKHNFDVHIADNDHWTALHYSARNGSHELITLFADMGKDIHLANNSGWNCLHIAALYGHLDLCKTLIYNFKFDSRVTDYDGWTVIHYAVRSGSYELFRLFVDDKTDIHLKNNLGWNCLHVAALCGHLRFCKTLIDKHNFNVHSPSDAGATALHYAARNGSYELVKFFVNMGSDIQGKDNFGQNCLHIAAASNHLNLCEILLNRHNFNMHVTDSNGWTAIHYSVVNGSYKLVTYFADMGADIYLKDNLGQNCLHIAAFSGHLNLCRTLLDKYNFDVHKKSNTGWTALHYSARNGSHRLFTFFANMTSDIYVKDNLGQNCLHIAAAYKHLNLCKILVEKHNFDINITDNDGRIALHHSAKSGSFDLVTYFANKGNNIHFKDSLGCNCLHIAAFSGHLNLCRTLINQHNFNAHMADNDGWTALHYSARNGSYDLVTYFAEVGINVYIRTTLGQNCLHIAALYGHMILCKTLLDKHNFDMQTVDNNGWTAFHCSARSGSYELVSFFMDMGTDILVKDKLGQNCLHIAALCGHFNLCKKLINKHKVDVNTATNEGWTTLHFSARNGTYKLFKLFTDMGTNIYLNDNSGRNCLHIAALFGHLELCKTFVDRHKFDVLMTDSFGWAALHCSARNGSYDLVTLFADMGTDIDVKDNLGRNCLHIAALYGHLNLCKTLIDKHNFDVHMADENGWTALHYSARNGSYELLTCFTGMGSNIGLKDNFGRNSLHFAALSGHLNLCRILLDKHKFNVDMADNGGCTALHFSAENGSYELITYFVNMGSDIHLKDNLGRNCLHIATLHGHLNLSKTLIDEDNFDVQMADNDGWRALHYSARNGSYELFTFFVDKGSDVHIKTKNGTNCLHIASLYGHLNLCKTFIDKYNFDVFVANNDEWRALHFSAKNGSFNLFSYILEKGSEIYCKTKSMENVLHLAAHEGHYDVCEFVLEYFIKDYKDKNTMKQYTLNGKFYSSQVFYKYKTIFLHAMDVDGNTYLHLAAQGNQAEICELLLKYDTEIITLLNKKDETARKIAKDNGYKDVLNALNVEYERSGMSFVILKLHKLKGFTALARFYHIT